MEYIKIDSSDNGCNHINQKEESMINVETEFIETFSHVDDFNEAFIRELQTHH